MGSSKTSIAVFGEVLWDIFGDERTIGGAPFNFAAHAARLGADVGLISAVGGDALGDEAMRIAEGYGIDVREVARVGAPTGYCRVTLDGGKPTYDLVRGVAYDLIPPPGRVVSADAFYFGSLAARSEISRRTLERLLEGAFTQVFFDINIRQNYYSKEFLDYAARRSTILKLSREEMGVFDLGGDCGDVCVGLSKLYPNLRLIVLTKDKDGAIAYETERCRFHEAPKPSSRAVSTVGAGDSFSACFLVNYMERPDIDLALSRAVALSDYVVTQLGAVPDYSEELLSKIRD